MAIDRAGKITLVKGDSYPESLNRELRFDDSRLASGSKWPILTGAVMTLEIDDGAVEVTGRIVDGTSSTKTVAFSPTGSQTGLLDAGSYDYNVVASYPGTGTGTSDDDRVSLTGTWLDAARKCIVYDRED